MNMPLNLPPLTMPISRRLFCGLALTTVGAAQAQVADLNDAINKAGRQRMVSQRMSKAYLFLGQGIEVAAARRDRKSVV